MCFLSKCFASAPSLTNLMLIMHFRTVLSEQKKSDHNCRGVVVLYMRGRSKKCLQCCQLCQKFQNLEKTVRKRILSIRFVKSRCEHLLRKHNFYDDSCAHYISKFQYAENWLNASNPWIKANWRVVQTWAALMGIHNVKMSGFFCHLDCTWNHFCSFWSLKNYHFDHLGSSESSIFGNFWQLSSLKFCQK